MFIKELWNFNKKATLFFVLFILLWCCINVKQGAVATPLLQYGMFSGPYHIKDTQNILHIYVNEKIVDFTKYSMSERDQLQVGLEYYLAQKGDNEMVYTTMKRILSKGSIDNLMKEEMYTCKLTDEDFTKWYTKIIEKITGEKVIKLAAYHQKYIFQSGRLADVTTPVKINCIVAN